MKKTKYLFKRWFRKTKKNEPIEGEFKITDGLPIPIKNVNYQDQLRIIKTLESFPTGDSFPIRNELVNPVRRVARDRFPEYKIVIKNFGTSHRVFRVA
jgi:hypothetical protein